MPGFDALRNRMIMLWCVIATIDVAIMSVVAYIAWHFICKFW